MFKKNLEHRSRKKVIVSQTNRHTVLREQLIDAAERTIASKGLAALRARDLARETGCAVGTIYNVFEHLDELVLCVGSRTLMMLEAALAAARPPVSDGSGTELVDDLVRLALAYLEFAATHTVRWRSLFEHRLSADRPLPEWFVEQQYRLFAQVERPLTALLPQLDREGRRLLARTVFSAVHGIVALGLEEKLVSLSLSDLAGQLTAIVRAIAAGREKLRAIDSAAGPADLRRD
jgi:AcrR family transcriptional regulator